MSDKYYWEFQTSQQMPWWKTTQIKSPIFYNNVDPVENEPDGEQYPYKGATNVPLEARWIAELEYQVNKMGVILNLSITKWINFAERNDLWTSIYQKWETGEAASLTNAVSTLLLYIESLNFFDVYDKLFDDLKIRCEAILSNLQNMGISKGTVFHPQYRIKPPSILNYGNNWHTKKDFIYDRSIQEIRYFLEYLYCYAEYFNYTWKDYPYSGASSKSNPILGHILWVDKGKGGSNGSSGSWDASNSLDLSGSFTISASATATAGAIFALPAYWEIDYSPTSAGAYVIGTFPIDAWILPDTILEINGGYTYTNESLPGYQKAIDIEIVFGEGNRRILLSNIGTVNLWNLLVDNGWGWLLKERYQTYTIEALQFSIKCRISVFASSSGIPVPNPDSPTGWSMLPGPTVTSNASMSISNIKALKHYKKDYYKNKTQFVYSL